MNRKSAQTDLLRVEMIKRGVSAESLAARCGVSVRTLRNEIALNLHSRRLRLRIEDTLGLPIWSAPEEFEGRRAAASRCGFDLQVLSTAVLREKLAQLKIRGRGKARRKEDLMELLQHHCTKNHKPKRR